MIAVTSWFQHEWRAYCSHSLSRCRCYMLILLALTCFEGNDDRNGGTIWICAASPRHPFKRARPPKSKLDHVNQLNYGRVRTYASCETASNIGELSFRQTMTDYIFYTSHFVVSLQHFSFCCKPLRVISSVKSCDPGQFHSKTWTPHPVIPFL